MMDKGIRIGSWGQLQEWKVDLDDPTDFHRHLSHLVGLYPGYAITNYDPTLQASPANNSVPYTKQQVLDAARTSLVHRGNGTVDGDAGWEKLLRAAMWAQCGDGDEFYQELSVSISPLQKVFPKVKLPIQYGLGRNFVRNLFSILSPSAAEEDQIFQIDANLGFPAVLLVRPSAPFSSWQRIELSFRLQNCLIQAPDVLRCRLL